MLRQFNLFLLFMIAILFVACGSEQSSNTDSTGDGMAKFAEEDKFKKAHEIPDSLSYQGGGEMISFETTDGTNGTAYAFINHENTDRALFVIHEWWGLNDHIKQEAERLYNELDGVNVYALDLYDGKVADNPDDAGKFMQGVKEERLNAIINGALKEVGPDSKVGTIGWCFGGGWSLRSSILAGEQGAGCVMYYGMPVMEPANLAPLKADVLGLFAKKDGWITPEIVDQFEKVMKAVGKNVETKQFDAEHAFANPSSPRYKEAAAQEANAMALKFLRERL